MVSSCCSREMLSESNSRISTYCPALIFSTSFLGNGWDPGDRATSDSGGIDGILVPTRVMKEAGALATAAVVTGSKADQDTSVAGAAMWEAECDGPGRVWTSEMSGTDDSADGKGVVPSKPSGLLPMRKKDEA